MGCNCGGGKVAYAVTLKDGTTPPGSPFATYQQATQAVRNGRQGGTIKPVKSPALTSGPRQ